MKPNICEQPKKQPFHYAVQGSEGQCRAVQCCAVLCCARQGSAVLCCAERCGASLGFRMKTEVWFASAWVPAGRQIAIHPPPWTASDDNVAIMSPKRTHPHPRIARTVRADADRQCSAVQCSAVQCSAVQRSAVQCSIEHVYLAYVLTCLEHAYCPALPCLPACVTTYKPTHLLPANLPAYQGGKGNRAATGRRAWSEDRRGAVRTNGKAERRVEG